MQGGVQSDSRVRCVGRGGGRRRGGSCYSSSRPASMLQMSPAKLAEMRRERRFDDAAAHELRHEAPRPRKQMLRSAPGAQQRQLRSRKLPRPGTVRGRTAAVAAIWRGSNARWKYLSVLATAIGAGAPRLPSGVAPIPPLTTARGQTRGRRARDRHSIGTRHYLASEI